MKTKRIYTIISVLSVLLLTTAYIVYRSHKEFHRVLVIQSYAKNYPTYPDDNDRIKNQFEKNNIDADIRTVYLDCELYSEKLEINHLNELIHNATRDGWQPELIIVNNDQATYSLLKTNNPLVSKLPIVFAGVEYPNRRLLDKFKNMTGFIDRINVLKNIELIKAIMGDDVDIYSPFDDSYLGKKVTNDIIKQIKGQKIIGKYNTPHLSIHQIQKLKEKEGFTIYDNYIIANYTNLKENDLRLISMIRVFKKNSSNDDNSNRQWPINMELEGTSHLIYKCDKFSDLLLKTCPGPIFTAMNKEFGISNNVIGGYMTSKETEAKSEVTVAARILRGEDISKFPITQSRRNFVINWFAIKHFNIDPERLSKSYIVINRPFKDQYPSLWATAVITTVIVIFFSLIFYIYEIRKRRKIKRILNHQHNILKASLYAAKAYTWEMSDGYFDIDDYFWEGLGKKPRKVSIKEFMLLISQDMHQRITEAFEDVKKGKGGTVQFQIATEGKGYSWWESRYFISKSNKKNYNAYGLTFNIDETKRHEKELEELRLLAEKAEMKQSFLENINHEIRTPLNSITGFSHILATDKSLNEDEKNQYIKLVDTNNTKLLQIIDNILLISQLESGELVLNPEQLDVRTLIDGICHACEHLASSGIAFNKINAQTDCCIFADKRYVTKAIQHIVENALKFTFKGYVKVKYDIDTTTDSVRILVEDTGLGIDTDERKMIFNQFYKQNRFGEGTGLGLTISRLIIEKSGGKIELKSEKGKGTCFTLTFPIFH